MNIEFRTQPAPTIPDHIAEALREMSPEVFLIWNPKMYERKDKTLIDGSHPWEGRWEIWIELQPSTHKDHYSSYNNVSVGRHFNSGWRHGVS